MKVFLSWSGDLSKDIAEEIRQWLPSVIQAVKPYYTPDDITKGARWASEIAGELNESKVGIICLTKENVESPWIMFEAGALSKKLSDSKVCPILFGLDPSDIKGPLVQFQAAKFSKTEIYKVLTMINESLRQNALDSEVINSVFEMWWPKLESKINDLLSSHHSKAPAELRSDRDILNELLELARSDIGLDKGELWDRALKSTTPAEAFRFFSGNSEEVNNHPAIYAGSGKLIVVGSGRDVSYPMKDFKLALKDYVILLKECDYLGKVDLQSYENE